MILNSFNILLNILPKLPCHVNPGIPDLIVYLPLLFIDPNLFLIEVPIPLPLRLSPKPLKIFILFRRREVV